MDSVWYGKFIWVFFDNFTKVRTCGCGQHPGRMSRGGGGHFYVFKENSAKIINLISEPFLNREHNVQVLNQLTFCSSITSAKKNADVINEEPPLHCWFSHSHVKIRELLHTAQYGCLVIYTDLYKARLAHTSPSVTSCLLYSSSSLFSTTTMVTDWKRVLSDIPISTTTLLTSNLPCFLPGEDQPGHVRPE